LWTPQAPRPAFLQVVTLACTRCGHIERQLSEQLEKSAKPIEITVSKVIDFPNSAWRRVEDALKPPADDNKSFAKRSAELAAQVARRDGRLTHIPIFWQTIAILKTSLMGISGLLFTTSRFLCP
jgi:hypothetical protein